MRCARPSLRCIMQKKAWTRIQAFSLNLAVREGLIRCAHPAGRRWRSKTQAFCRTLSRLLAPLGGAPCKKKAWTRIQAFSLNLAVREGLIRCAHPAGRRWRSKTQAFCRTLSRLLAPLGGAPCKKKAWTRIQAFSLNLAVREGFEPSIHFRVYTLSRRAPSATQTPHRFVVENALRCRRALM